ncbi:MAG: hypothetical protein M3Q39_04365 [Actinomycetota bacterium]|nr:hypothetical protein [Actinomycetota bacterium]
MTTTIPRQVVNARRIAGVLLVLSALGTVIVLVVLAAWWATQSPSVTGVAGTPSNTPTTTVPRPQQSVPPQPVSAEVALQQQVEGDRPQVDALVDSWVPQLSAKAVGLEADGIVYGYGEILHHFNSLRARYPQALLLRSDDYVNYALKGYWVTVMPIEFSSGESANSWCDGEGIDPDNCYAKLLLHTGGPDGTTLPRK